MRCGISHLLRQRNLFLVVRILKAVDVAFDGLYDVVERAMKFTSDVEELVEGDGFRICALK